MCAKIKNTLSSSLDKIKNKDVQVIVFNTSPEANFEKRAEYLKSYKDAGIDPDRVTILFTKVKGKPDNAAAKKIETDLLINLSRGHSTSITVFNGKGERMGKIAASDEPGSARQKVKIDEIVAETRKALGIEK